MNRKKEKKHIFLPELQRMHTFIRLTLHTRAVFHFIMLLMLYRCCCWPSMYACVSKHLEKSFNTRKKEKTNSQMCIAFWKAAVRCVFHTFYLVFIWAYMYKAEWKAWKRQENKRKRNSNVRFVIWLFDVWIKRWYCLKRIAWSYHTHTHTHTF